jgi:hypothetical protein
LFSHGGERTALHDILQEDFVAIATDVGFYVLEKQTHVFLPLPYNLCIVKLTMCY